VAIAVIKGRLSAAWPNPLPGYEQYAEIGRDFFNIAQVNLNAVVTGYLYLRPFSASKKYQGWLGTPGQVWDERCAHRIFHKHLGCRGNGSGKCFQCHFQLSPYWSFVALMVLAAREVDVLMDQRDGLILKRG
jgi:hypothetical protein